MQAVKSVRGSFFIALRLCGAAQQGHMCSSCEAERSETCTRMRKRKQADVALSACDRALFLGRLFVGIFLGLRRFAFQNEREDECNEGACQTGLEQGVVGGLPEDARDQEEHARQGKHKADNGKDASLIHGNLLC